jgi:hypothetical protein
MVASTVRKAAGHLATAFRHNHQPSPLHVEGSPNLLPSIRSLFRAFDNVDPAISRQKAVTPKLLRRMFRVSGTGLAQTHDTAFAVVTELAIFGYFFAMRSCENTSTPKPGRTKIICLLGMIFRDANKNVIPHTHPGLITAVYVTVVFVDQKNKQKMDSRTQQRTGDPILCPILRGASLVARIIRTVPAYTAATTINTTHADGATLCITGEYMRTQLRATCQTYGGKAEFGFAPMEIGTKSIRSGAAMALFLQNHSSDKIMILGRWMSKAFLDYIRPQVLEWTNNMSRDMVTTTDFTDVGRFDMADPQVPRLRPNRFNGLDDAMLVPRMYLHH